ncbi:MAG: histidine phosphatase family protein [Zoogloeaceae bacterium]|nr:histidine phosphatase family protein [Zoogloeaceae bacterium]MCK6384802.1 histidine phosphatase family protein [Rhodocyclaceae bacterium]
MKRFWLALLAALLAPAARADEALWAKLKAGGNLVLMRHAATEGGAGEPPGFRLDDCATQRNLSEAGREEARRVGRQFKFRAINFTTARSSQWCRCLETARLAFGAEPESWPLLNSLNAQPDKEFDLIGEVTALAAKVEPPYNAALVTHDFNIRALTGISPRAAEIVIVRGGSSGLEVVGRIPLPAQ